MAANLARSQRTSGGGPGGGRSLLKVGDKLAGKYRVQRILGEGGMGVVVAAYHEMLDQHVAVKLLYQDVADREAQSRLLLEARSAAKLQSEHVARVLDFDTGADGLPFIVMELLEGVDLCQLADARGALPTWMMVDCMLQALEGLAHAHAHGIVHRDLKPSNLFLARRPDGTEILKILDFGISKSIDGAGDRRAQQLTGGRTVLGSPPYMSPEQVRSPKTVDHRTDIWSAGVCMYELLTNSMPFGGDEIQETFAQILEKAPVPIRQLVAGVPEGLEQVIMRCLAKNRDDRFAEVGELARALAPFGTGTWAMIPERVVATLARGAEEASSGLRLARDVLPIERVPIPSSRRKLDGMQPELTGTASTVALGYDRGRRWLFAVALVPAVVGVVLGAMALVDSRSGLGRALGSAGAPPPSEPLAPAVVETAAREAPQLEETADPTGVVTGTDAAAAPDTKSPSRKSSPLETGAPRPASAAASPKKSSTSSTATSSRPALPPGLPLTRQ
jgi:eukaryotic-like serine/threonine-protein kinase